VGISVTLLSLLVAAIVLLVKGLRRGRPSAGSSPARRAAGYVTGAAVGTVVGLASGPSNMVGRPDLWREDWELNSDTVSFCVLGWALIGRMLVGGTYGALDRWVLAGTVLGWVASEFVWVEAFRQGALAGAAVGLVVGLAAEMATRRFAFRRLL
jgi:hypothetical protein